MTIFKIEKVESAYSDIFQSVNLNKNTFFQNRKHLLDKQGCVHCAVMGIALDDRISHGPQPTGKDSITFSFYIQQNKLNTSGGKGA